MKRTLVAALGSAPRGTQSRIADALGVRPQAVNKWAKGYNVPEPETWARLEPLLREMGLLEDPARSDPPDTTSREELDVTQLVLGIAEEIRLLRVEFQRLGDAYQQLADPPRAPSDPPTPKRQRASRAARPITK